MKSHIILVALLVPLLCGCSFALRGSSTVVPEAINAPSGHGLGLAASFGVDEQGVSKAGGDSSFHLEGNVEFGYRLAFASVLLRGYFNIDIDENRGLIFAPAVGFQGGYWRGNHVYGIATRAGLNYYWNRESHRAVRQGRSNSYTYVGIEPTYVFVGEESGEIPVRIVLTIGFLSM